MNATDFSQTVVVTGTDALSFHISANEGGKVFAVTGPWGRCACDVADRDEMFDCTWNDPSGERWQVVAIGRRLYTMSWSE